MTTVVVSGAGGFAGRAIVRGLGGAGHTVRAVAAPTPSARTRSALESSGATLSVTGLDDEEALVSAARGAEAWVHVPPGEFTLGSRAEHNQHTAIPAETALAAAKRSGVRRFVLISSDQVSAGDQDRPYIDESFPHSDRFVSPFAEAIALAEALVLADSTPSTFETVALRPALLWGPDDDETLPRWIRRVRNGTLAYVGDGRTLMPTTLVDNLADAVTRVIEASGGGVAFHVTDDERISARSFVQKLLVSAGAKAPRGRVPYRLAYLRGWWNEHRGVVESWTRSDAVRFGRTTVFNLKAIREQLEYQPISIDEGMKRVASWANEVGGADAIAQLDRP